MKLRIFILITSVLVILPMMFFGCKTQDTSELEEKVAELEEQIEELGDETSLEEEAEEAEEEAEPEKETIEQDVEQAVTGPINLTNNQASDGHPSWSPDGTKIAFSSDRNGDLDVFIMNADGSEQINITNDPEIKELSPDWSPDGNKILYRAQAGKIPKIFIMNIDGSEKTDLTYNRNSRDVGATWSPDGKMIAFESAMGDREDIYIMNSDGSGLFRVTDNPGKNYAPSWSPDGEKIAFVSDLDGRRDIFIINIDGTGQKNLMGDFEGESFAPDWSPDGEKIAFYSDIDGDFEIFIMNADGSDIYQVTNNWGEDTYPDWSPDGKKIAFTWDQDIGVIDVENESIAKEELDIVFYSDPEQYSIYGCKYDGSSLQMIFNSGSNDIFPNWNNEHSKIIFSSDMDGDDVYDVFIYDIKLDKIDRVTDRGANDWGAVFNPVDNSTIIFGGPVENNENSDWAIFSVNIDGSGLKKLTDDPGGEYAPNYSPDGNTILFTSDNEGNEELFLMDSNAGNMRNITNNAAKDFYGSFSPDGKNIVFSSSRNSPPDIYILSVNNPEEVKNLTNSDSVDTQPDYSPDGTKIIFNSNRSAIDGSNTFDIVIMDPDGSNQIVITENYSGISSSYPKW